MANSKDSSPVPVIYVIDDDEDMRNALTALLSTIGHRSVMFSRADEFIRQFDPGSPGCLVLDIRLPDMSGLELQQHLRQMGSMLPVLFITGHGDVPMAVQAMREGAFEFIQKPFRGQDLIDRINHAIKHDAENRGTRAERAEVLLRVASLTSRERQVMDLVVDGRANKIIAMDLQLSERTIEIHRAKVMEKMGARSVAHLVKLTLTLIDKP
jgi:FixJ family two-component response regulator